MRHCKMLQRKTIQIWHKKWLSIIALILSRPYNGFLRIGLAIELMEFNGIMSQIIWVGDFWTLEYTWLPVQSIFSSNLSDTTIRNFCKKTHIIKTSLEKKTILIFIDCNKNLFKIKICTIRYTTFMTQAFCLSVLVLFSKNRWKRKTVLQTLIISYN